VLGYTTRVRPSLSQATSCRRHHLETLQQSVAKSRWRHRSGAGARIQDAGTHVPKPDDALSPTPPKTLQQSVAKSRWRHRSGGRSSRRGQAVAVKPSRSRGQRSRGHAVTRSSSRRGSMDRGRSGRMPRSVGGAPGRRGGRARSGGAGLRPSARAGRSSSGRARS
jgi:hypothetical protein